MMGMRKKVFASLRQIDWHLLNFLKNLQNEFLNKYIKDYSIIVLEIMGQELPKI